MKPVKTIAPIVSIAVIAACGSSQTQTQTQNPADQTNASISFQTALPGSDFTGNSVAICGTRAQPAEGKFRCASTLSEAIGTPGTDFVPIGQEGCPCFQFNADGSLGSFLATFANDNTDNPVFSPSEPSGAFSVNNLCPSADLPSDNGQGDWTFTYTIWTGQTCGADGTGQPLTGAGNQNENNFICFDSQDIAAQTFPNQTANETLNPGPNTNHVICETSNGSKTFDFASCSVSCGALNNDGTFTASTQAPEQVQTGVGAFNCSEPNAVNVLSCGCSGTPPDNCDCGNGPTELPDDCQFANEAEGGSGETCAIVCTPPGQSSPPFIMINDDCTCDDAFATANDPNGMSHGSCRFAGPPGTPQVVIIPAGTMCTFASPLSLVNQIFILGANNGTPGYGTRAEAESVIRFTGSPGDSPWFIRPGNTAGTEGPAPFIDGVTIEGPDFSSDSTLAEANYAIGGWSGESFTLQNSIVTGFGSGVFASGLDSTVVNNWIHDNNGPAGSTNAPDDVSGSGVVSTADIFTRGTIIELNLFTNQRFAGVNLTAALHADSGLSVFGNLFFNVPSQPDGAAAVYLNNPDNVEIFNNVLISTGADNQPSNGIEVEVEVVSDHMRFIGNTVNGFTNGFRFTGDGGFGSLIFFNNNRIVHNEVGILNDTTAAEPNNLIVATQNWLELNGTDDSAVPPATLEVSSPLQLTCTTSSNTATTGTPIDVTGTVPGLPTVDGTIGGNAIDEMATGITAAEVRMPIMDAALIGVDSSKAGFPDVPSNGVSGEATLTGTFTPMGTGPVTATVTLDDAMADCTLATP